MKLIAIHGKGIASPVRVAIVHPTLLSQWDLGAQSQILVKTAQGQQVVWVYPRLSDAPEATSPRNPSDASAAQEVDVETILLSKRAREALGDEPELEVQVSLPKTVHLCVAPGIVDDLPPGDEVHVALEVIQFLEPKRGWVLLVHDGCSIPVRLRSRNMKPGQVRLSMLTRSLLSSVSTLRLETVQISKLLDVRWPFFRAPVHRLRGLMSRCFESLLRPLLGATRVVLRTTHAQVGDDNEQIARLHSDVFPLLGIKPGDHVIVSWAGRQVFAVALERENLTAEEREALKNLQMVNLFVQGENRAIVDHLSIGLSAILRAQLGIPPRSAVMIRRRLATTFLAQLNQLALPILGLAIAATKFSNVSIWIWLLGLVGVLIVGMSPVRHRKPPRGRLS